MLRWLVMVVMALALAAPAGAASSLTVAVDTEAFRKVEAEAIAEMLRAIDVAAEVWVWEASALREMIKNGERAMYLTDWGSAYFGPFDLAEPKLTTGSRGNFSFCQQGGGRIAPHRQHAGGCQKTAEGL